MNKLVYLVGMAEAMNITNTTHGFCDYVPSPALTNLKNGQRLRKIRGHIDDVRTEPKVGRNEPCPCGSGMKYKKCCITKK